MFPEQRGSDRPNVPQARTCELSSSSRDRYARRGEYNRSIPGVLKNAFDHASRPYGQNAWAGRPAGVLGVSVGAIGTSVAQQHLRNVRAYLDVLTLGQPEAFIQAKEGLFDEAGDIGAASKGFFQSWMDRYVAWVKHHAA